MSYKKPIKIWFTDMWPGFHFKHNHFTYLLSQNFNIQIDPDPDYLIHSVYTKNYLKYNCCRICFTGENTRPDFTRSDYHIGFDYNKDPRYLRWPLFLTTSHSPEYLLKDKDIDSLYTQKKRFCSFVVSNDAAKERIEFFKKLSGYKKVDSGGRILNNTGSTVADKLEFLRESKFNIAFENESSPGYTTEKIFDAFLANCIPIYWGNPRVSEDFNEKAFINVHNYKTTEELIEHIQYLDENEDAYKSMLQESAFIGNAIPEQFGIEKFITFFNHIFNEGVKKKWIHRFGNKIEYMDFKMRQKMFVLKRRYLN